VEKFKGFVILKNMKNDVADIFWLGAAGGLSVESWRTGCMQHKRSVLLEVLERRNGVLGRALMADVITDSVFVAVAQREWGG